MNIQQLLELLNEQLTDEEIGTHIGASQSIVNRLRRGVHKKTNYERGMAIHNLAVSRGLIKESQPQAS
jgi:IS30 family transposase